MTTPSRPPTELRHPAARRSCRDCGGDGFVVVREGEWAVSRLCSCVGPCPVCHGSGLVAVSDAFRAPRKRCACQAVLHRMRLFDAVGIPGRHADSTVASFVDGSRHQTAVKQSVWAYAKAFRPGEDNRGLVLYGGVGRGKTHLAVALVRELVVRMGVTAKFVEFSHLLADLKSGFDSGRGAAELIDPLVEVQVLLIDELGKGRNTEFEGTVLDELVSRRYNAVRPIVATTNYPPMPASGRAVPSAADVQLGTAPAPSLVDRVGDRVFSRLRETCDFVELKGDDFREQRRTRRTPPPSAP
ncbi:MAG: AFG1/ZapE family ATPase [Myxococcota bacterium]